jgi:hypothetical protein
MNQVTADKMHRIAIKLHEDLFHTRKVYWEWSKALTWDFPPIFDGRYLSFRFKLMAPRPQDTQVWTLVITDQYGTHVETYTMSDWLYKSVYDSLVRKTDNTKLDELIDALKVI